MKSWLWILAFAIRLPALAQEKANPSALELSTKIFQWEVSGKLDSLAEVLNTHLVVVGSDGSTRTKDEYMQRLRSGAVVHNSIEIEDSVSTTADNTAIVAGKGRFTLTSGGNKNTMHLSYMEVFSRQDDRSAWKLLAIKANALPN